MNKYSVRYQTENGACSTEVSADGFSNYGTSSTFFVYGEEIMASSDDWGDAGPYKTQEATHLYTNVISIEKLDG